MLYEQPASFFLGSFTLPGSLEGFAADFSLAVGRAKGKGHVVFSAPCFFVDSICTYGTWFTD